MKRLLLAGWLALALAGAMAWAQDAAPGVQALADLMEQARQAMLEAQYNLAVETYGKLAAMPDHAYRRDAQELLGLACERAGRLDRARGEYERYLQLYPEGDGAARVRQRLAALVTADWKAPEKLGAAQARTGADGWRVSGAFSQYLRRDASEFEGQGEEVTQFSLDTRLDLNARRRGAGYDLKTRFSGGYLRDLDDATGSQGQVSYLYLDLSQRGQGWFTTLGRQRASGGALGRFDGLTLGRRFAARHALSLLGGMPVERSTDLSPDSGRRFLALDYQTGPWAQYWELNGYAIEQRADGLLDRRALGGELRYNHPERTLYALADYDLSYSQLNILTSQATWTLQDKTTFSFMFDYRNAPPLATSNALIGQNAQTLDGLGASYSEDQIRQLARDRSPHNYMAMAGVSRPLGANYRLDADFTGSNLGPTPGSGGVPASAGTPNEFYFSTRLTASHLWRQGDAHILGLRLADTALSDQTSLSLNSRLPLASGWRLNPRLQLDRREYKDSGDNQLALLPGLRLERDWDRRYHLELDAGLEWTRRDTWLGTQDYRSHYLNLGYRVDF